jgi:DNA processing protein
LIGEYGTAEAALAALPGIASDAGVSNYQICPEGVVHKELNAARKAGARLLVHGHEGYPSAFDDQGDAPPVLWALGRPEMLSKPMLAMVGARNASSLGTRMARALAEELGKSGHVIVSGLARGVDTAAHKATLDTGTVAVLGGGVDVIYPVENTGLAEQIRDKGVLLSEQPMGLQPMARHFPARNRIIAALGRACIVVEAAARSGSLITARDALDLGREVMAVPGHPFDARASGCNMLIRDGATLVRCASDVLDQLGPLAKDVQPQLDLAPPAPVRAATHALHQEILDRLGPSPVAEDQLIRDLQAGPLDVAPALTDLELDGKIERRAGGLLSRVG